MTPHESKSVFCSVLDRNGVASASVHFLPCTEQSSEACLLSPSPATHHYIAVAHDFTAVNFLPREIAGNQAFINDENCYISLLLMTLITNPYSMLIIAAYYVTEFHATPIRGVASISRLCRWRNGDSERVGDLPKFLLPVSSGAGIQIGCLIPKPGI